jgi:hypothetical protein
MIKMQEPELKPYEDHSAWQAGWNEDEAMLAGTPPGYWFDLVNISRVKRVLQEKMLTELRLRFLEYLNSKSVHGHLNLEAMQAVKPACDTAMAMLNEMSALDIDDQCRLMRKWNLMAAFVNLNPSIMDAIKVFRFNAERVIASDYRGPGSN